MEIVTSEDSDAPAPSDRPRPPRPWLAALLSVLSPGLGHVYLWRLREALGFWALFFVTGALALLAFIALQDIVNAVVAFLVAAAGALAINVAIAARAWRTARVHLTRRRPSRGLLALALIGWYVVLGLPHEFLLKWVKRNVIEAFHYPSGAMAPTILVGDYFFAKVRGDAAIESGALYTFRRDGSIILMRVVGFGGDTLAMRGGALLRNGRPIAEPYARTEGAPYGVADDFAWQRSHLLDSTMAPIYAPTADDWGPLVVPTESVFVLGDNRHEALDSRFTGPVAEEDVLGYPTQVYFSRAPDGDIRWARIGLRLD